MAVRVPDITSRIRVDTRGLDQAEGKVGKSTSKMGSAFGKLAAATAAFGAAAAVGKFAKDSISVASDLSEEVSKSEAVFGRASASVAKFAKTTTKSLGISQNDALAATGTFGNLFTALKIGEEQAASMATELVTLAGDLASFNNVDTTTALDSLRAGLAGETEPLKKFGVNINDATLKAKAFELGLIASVKDGMDPATKAHASYALILEQTAKAQGDASKTIGGLAGQQRVFSASVEDLQSQLGTLLLPAATKVTTALVGVVDATLQLGPATDRAVKWFEEHQAAASVLASVLTVKLVPALIRSANTSRVLASVRVLEWFDGVKGGSTGAAGGMRGFAKSAVIATARVALLVGALETLTRLEGKREGQAGQEADLIAARAGEDRRDQIAALTEELERQQEVAARGVNAFGVLYSDHGASRAAVRAEVLAGRIATLTHEGELAAASAVATGESQEEAFRGVTEATDDLAESQGDADRKVRRFKGALDNLRGAMEKLFRKTFGVEEATSNWQAAIDDLRESLKDNGKTLDLSTEKGRENRAAMRDLVSTAQERVAAVYEETRSIKDANETAKAQRRRLREVLEQAGLTKEQIEKYTGAVKNIPKSAKTTLHLEKKKAERDLAKFLRRLDRLPSIDVNLANRVKDPLAGRTHVSRPRVTAPQGPPAAPRPIPAGVMRGGVTVTNHIYAPQAAPKETADALVRKFQADAVVKGF